LSHMYCMWDSHESYDTLSVFVNSSNRIFVMDTEFVLCEVGTYSFIYSVNGRQCRKCSFYFIFSLGETAPSGPEPPHCRGFTIRLWHTTLGRIPLDEWSARHRDLYLPTNNTHKRQTCMPPAGFEPTMPPRVRPQTHALGRAATGVCGFIWCRLLKVSYRTQL
jgi:hypothetical protein